MNLKRQKDTNTCEQEKEHSKNRNHLLKSLIKYSQKVLKNHYTVKGMHQRKLKEKKRTSLRKSFGPGRRLLVSWTRGCCSGMEGSV